MGKNSQQRRANKKRLTHRQQKLFGGQSSTFAADRIADAAANSDIPEATINGLILQAALVACGEGEHKGMFHALTDQLHLLEQSQPPHARPSAIVAARLREVVTLLYESGWQPGDIAHSVKRKCSAKAHRLIAEIIAGEARKTDAVHRAPPLWLAQLAELDVFDPVRNVIVGGSAKPVADWARDERVHPDEALTLAVQVLGHLRLSPRVAVLGEPPSAWGASNRGIPAKPKVAPGPADPKALKLIRALLAKAEATTFEAEAATFTAKAQEMMTRYSIDVAVLASKVDAGRYAAGVESRRMHIDSPYSEEKASLLSVIAEVNGVKAVWSPAIGSSTVVGFAVDLQLTDLLFTSLLVQATHASAEATAIDRNLRTPSFRRAFLLAFADRIGERLQASKQTVASAAEQNYGSALVPILAAKAEAVTSTYERIFPHAVLMKSRRLNSHGYHAGRAAADRAQIGAGEQIAQSSG